MNACLLKYSHVAFLGHTRQWKKPTKRVFMLYTFNLCQSQQPEFGLTFNVEAETGAVLRKKAVPAQSVVTTQWCTPSESTLTY